jgi:hypothetical protein
MKIVTYRRPGPKSRFVWGRCAIIMAIAGLAAGSAAAFSIEGVTFTPRPLAATVPVTMLVYVVTPNVPAELYAPTQVLWTGTHVRVDIYPTCGMLPIIGSITVSAPLGALEVGDYTYEVESHPAWPVGWGTNYVSGTFAVLPQIKVSPSGTNLVLRWPASATSFVLEAACECSSAGWAGVTNTPIQMGQEMVLTNHPQLTRQFYRLRKQ